MSECKTRKLRGLEGRTISVALHGGDRIDGCQLVSAGRRPKVRTIWVVSNGDDRFLSLNSIIDVWEP